MSNKNWAERIVENVIGFEAWMAENHRKYHSGIPNKVLDDAEEKIEVCPEGLCDGSGYLSQGEFDEVEEARCLCNPK